MDRGWPDDKRQQGSAITANALDSSDHLALDSCATVVTPIILTYLDFDSAEHA